ncbi:MAG TPA: HEPN domain-containing protein [Labilithrix sp.]
MTGDNKRKNIEAETRRGDESLDSARILLGAGKHADAISRAYYAAFHYARALVLLTGEEPRTHGGLERLLHRDVVQPGLLAPDIAKLFSRLLKFRQDADYTAEFVFSANGAAEELAAAEAFVTAARAILAKPIV